MHDVATVAEARTVVLSGFLRKIKRDSTWACKMHERYSPVR
jgi:hypothetical protein